jgi:DNA uptake protein ComE-like DNA-binding protein
MRKTTLHLAVIGAAALALAGCSARRAQEKYHEVFGGAPAGRQLDLNSAYQKELAKLPGITDEDAARIVANRPYGSKRDLLRKSVLGERKYEQVQDYVYVREARRGGARYGDQLLRAASALPVRCPPACGDQRR